MYINKPSKTKYNKIEKRAYIQKIKLRLNTIHKILNNTKSLYTLNQNR